MSNDPVHVVVGFDFTDGASAALSRALGVVARAPWHVLHIVHVLERGSFADAERAEAQVAEAIRQAAAEAAVAGKLHFNVHSHIGRPAQEILRVAHDVGADLIIVGGNSHSALSRAVLGSVSEKVVREAGCTVEVARPKTYPFVPLLEVVEVEPESSHYVAPHRYTYEDNRVSLRPSEWPLY
jgi:nucleotide-binding universal stress UspA family protein